MSLGRPPRWIRVAVVFGVVGVLAAACGGGAVELPPFDFIDPAPPSSVDAVVFLIGDAGDAIEGRSPLIERLSQEVEEWSGNLARDSAVSVVYLGDNVYPYGLRDREHPGFPADSARLWTQIRVVGGPQAREYSTFAWFLPGNHDWGQMQGDEGIERVLNQVEAIEQANELGYNVSFIPPAASPGPVVRDLRRNVRLVALDTHWFLQERADIAKDEFFERITEALTGAEDRQVIVMAHHPYRSAGPHGALVSTTRALGILYLLKKAGALVQDLNSPVYQDFLGRLERTVRASGRPPLVFAGGHDHSLQVLKSDDPWEPRFSLVSGAGSKLTEVTNVPGLAYAAARPGYMKLIVRTDDVVELYVTGGNPDLIYCGQADATERAACMQEGVAAMDVIYSTRLDAGTVTLDERSPSNDP